MATFRRSVSRRTAPSSSWRLILLLALTLAGGIGLLAFDAQPVGAHAFLATSDPPANAVLATSPTAITLTFTERLERGSSRAALYDQNGTLVPNVSYRPGAGAKSMIVDVPPGLANGTYSVLWRTLSADDGHTAQGYIAFTVGTQSDVRPVVPPATTESSGPPLWLRTAARWTAYVGLAAVVAIWPVWLLVLRPAISPAWQAGPALTRRMRRLAVVAFGLALVGNVFALVVQSAGLDSGSFLDDLTTTLNDTRYGQLWFLRFGLLCLYGGALLAAAWWWPLKRPWRTGAALIGAAALPLPFSEIAHASAQTTGRTAAIAIDMLHLLAASLWIGGLFALVGALVPTLRDLTPAGRRVVLGRAIPRFSVLALASWRLPPGRCWERQGFTALGCKSATSTGCSTPRMATRW